MNTRVVYEILDKQMAKGVFEVSLSTRNRDTSKRYESPDFDNQDLLIDTIVQGIEKFEKVITSLL